MGRGDAPDAPMVVVVAPDSFKGSLDARMVAAAIGHGIARVLPAATIRICPMADGGEGTLDAILSTGGDRRTAVVTGAGGRSRTAAYGLVDRPEGRTAIVEVAEVVGITDPDGVSVSVHARTTRGVGELLRALLDLGVRAFMLALGGSSTNDGGAGLLAALGVRFLDASGRLVEPTPEGLKRLASVDARALDTRLGACALTILSDVTNPLCGPTGTTTVFGPQKGVRVEDIPNVDGVLARYAALAERAFGKVAATHPGAGAAGGLGFAARLLGGTFASGAEVVADLVGLDQALAGADWAITGEGRSDAQTLSGKAPFVVAARARKAGVPATLLSGGLDSAALGSLTDIFAGCFASPAGPTTLDACLAGADGLLADRASALAALWRATRRAKQ